MIETKGLTKIFGTTKALDNIDMQIKEGCIYGLVGSNGSGKSTFIRIASGVYTPEEGEILIDGQNPFISPDVKSRILFLSDSPYYFQGSSINDMAGFYKLMYSSFDTERFKYLTDVFPLNKLSPIAAMSKGMQRQAMLILALSCNPKYLFLDEAFDGLDPVMRNVLKQLLLDGVMQNNMTVLISSHNLRELEDLCDHLILLHRGKVIFNNAVDSLTGSLQKVHIVFKDGATPDLRDLDILKNENTGSLFRLIIRGTKEDVDAKLKAFEPVFYESVCPSIEEIFIYEMGVNGYDVQNILG